MFPHNNGQESDLKGAFVKKKGLEIEQDIANLVNQSWPTNGYFSVPISILDR